MKIKELLKLNIEDEIPLVIKADELNLETAQKEISQYIVTHQIERHLETFLDSYKVASTDKIGFWISGFFGSGKSYFAKMLGYLLMNEPLPLGVTAREYFNERLGNCANPEFLKGRIKSLSSIPAVVVMFEIIAEGAMNAETPQQVMFKKFLQRLGYSSVASVAIMERELDNFGHLDTVKRYIEESGENYRQVATNAGEFRRLVLRAMAEKLDYSKDEASDFLKSAVEKFDKLSPADFAEQCVDYAKKSGKRLVFIIDEIGQYVVSLRNNDDRILELQGVAEMLSSKGNGAVRLIVTSQEKLDQLIVNNAYDKRKLGKLTDRFEGRLDLTSENVDEVARERLLKKKPENGELFSRMMADNQGNISALTNTEGSYKKTETKEEFMAYYPFHPYQFHMLPDLVQGSAGATYNQATERKFIFLVDHILKALKDESFGRVVNAADLFDALGTRFFGSGVVNDVQKADKEYKAGQVKASDILKTLQILKNLPKVAATETVIARMLCKSVNDKQYEVQKEVNEAISFLEKGKRLSRYNGGITLVTDLEREFIEEVENAAADVPDRNEEIRTRLSDLFSYKELPYKNGPSIPVEWVFADKAFGGRKKGLKVKISPFAGTKREDLEFESMNQSDTVYAIPEDNSAIETLAGEIKKLEASLNAFRTKKTGGEIQDVLTKYAKILEEKRKTLRDDLRQSLDSGTLIYAGETLTGEHLLNKLKELLKDKVIPSLYSEITAASITTREIENALTKPQNTLKTLAADTDHSVFNENGELIETHKVISPVIAFLSETRSGSDLLDKFAAAPYGWAQETVLYAAACLMRAGKITINAQDSYSKPEILKTLKSASDFRSAKLRCGVTLDPSDKARLMELINPLLAEGKLTVPSPRSDFITRALEGLKRLDEKLTGLKKEMEELGAKPDWDLNLTRNLINELTGKGDDCLAKLLESAQVIGELRARAEKTDGFLEKNRKPIQKQKEFIAEMEGELAKIAFAETQAEEIAALVKEYKDTLPRIAGFGTDLDNTFEKLRNRYKACFNIVHQKRNDCLERIGAYLDSIRDLKNPAGKRAADQPWYRKLPVPCGELELRYSIKCENCHIGYREALLEIGSLEKELETLKESCDRFLQEKPETKDDHGNVTEKPPTKRVRIKRKTTYRELKNEIDALSLPETAEIELELED